MQDKRLSPLSAPSPDLFTALPASEKLREWWKEPKHRAALSLLLYTAVIAAALGSPEIPNNLAWMASPGFVGSLLQRLDSNDDLGMQMMAGGVSAGFAATLQETVAVLVDGQHTAEFSALLAVLLGVATFQYAGKKLQVRVTR